MATTERTDPRPPEQQPLLDAGSDADASYHGIDKAQQRWRWRPSFRTSARRYRFVPLLGCLIIFINEAEYFFKQVATMRAIESMYCVEFYIVRDPELAKLGKAIPERLCKDDQIQKQLAKTAGLIMGVRMIAAVIGIIPLGQLADRKGRKLVLVLHKINVLTSSVWWLVFYKLYPRVPIWALYFTGLPGLIGGNFDLGFAMLFASYTDVMPDEKQRATLFYLTTSMQYLAQLFCPPIGGWLMNLDGKGGTSDVAMSVSVAMAALAAILVIFFFPETVDRKKRSISGEHTAAVNDDEEDNERLAKRNPPTKGNKVANLWQTIKFSLAGVGFLNILLLALAMLSATVGIKATDWYGLLQYPVIKLGWTFSRASSVLSLQAIVMLLNFGVLLPAYTRVGTKYLQTQRNASFAIMVGSSIVLATGAVMTGLSTTAATFLIGMIIYTTGEGLTVAINAYIATVIEKRYLARVMAVLSLAATSGKAIASGLFPQVLALGLDMHVSALIGLPFLLAAGLFLVAGVCAAIAGLRTKSPDDVLEET